MPEQPLGQATFYQYKLLKKATLSRTLIGIYLLLPCAAIAVEMIVLAWYSFLFFLLALALVPWIHFVIGRSVLLIQSAQYPKRWRFSLHPLWLGYMPDQHVSRHLFQKVQVHTAWIGFCLFGVMAFLSPLSFSLSAFFWHIWLLLPRFYALLLFTRQPEDGMLKFSDQDISYYKQ